MNNSIDKIKNDFIRVIGDLSVKLGLSRIAGQLYGLLFLSEVPLSLDVMAKSLGVSKGSISLNIRALEEWGAVKKVWIKGSRKDFYEAELNTLDIVARRAKIAIKKRLDLTIGGIEDYKSEISKINGKTLNKEDTRRLSVYKERISRIEKMKDAVIMLLENIPDSMFGSFQQK